MKRFDPSKPVTTRDGKPVRIICTNAKGNYPVIGLIDDGRTETIAMRGADGTASFPNPEDCLLDFINAPSVTYKWRNIYKDLSKVAILRDSRSKADEYAGVRANKRIAVCKYTFTDDVLTAVEVEETFKCG